MVGVIVLFVLFAATVALLAVTVGAGGVTVILTVAGADVPPGPVAFTVNESLPL